MIVQCDSSKGDEPIKLEDIRQLIGDVDDVDTTAIIATGATRAELEQAWLCAQGYGHVVGRNGYPLIGAAAQVFDILASCREEDPPR
jgi:hypothetical protein